jgi:hypothetical protein
VNINHRPRARNVRFYMLTVNVAAMFILREPGTGIAAQSVFTALLLVAANVRKIRAWRALTGRDKARITRRARQRRASLRDYLPDG